jgi:threonine dehydrogenase-like Zn-dependent dehydrogenase
MGTDRPHVWRQAIHCCRNFGTVSIVGVYGGFVDKIPMGSAINRGLTFRMAQTPVQHYMPKLLERIEPEVLEAATSLGTTGRVEAVQADL